MRYILFPVATIFMVLVGLLAFEEPTRQSEASPVFNLYWAPDDDTITGVDTLTLLPEKNLDGRFSYNYTVIVAPGDSLTEADDLLNSTFILFENNKDINADDYADGWYGVDTLTFDGDASKRMFGSFVYGRRQKIEITTSDTSGVLVYDINATFKRE